MNVLPLVAALCVAAWIWLALLHPVGSGAVHLLLAAAATLIVYWWGRTR